MWRSEQLVSHLGHHKTEMPFFVINLDWRTDRLERVQKESIKAGINFKRVQARTAKEVDEKIIKLEWIAKLNAQFDTRQDPRISVKLSDGERGCAGSHAYIWNLIKYEKGPVCIMEDDIMFKENFLHILKQAVARVENNTNLQHPILYAEHLVAEWGDRGSNFTSTHSLRTIAYTWNTGCYIVWPSTVKVLLENLPMKEPVDCYLARLMYHRKINAVGINPSIGYQFCNQCDGDIIHTFEPVNKTKGTNNI